MTLLNPASSGLDAFTQNIMKSNCGGNNTSIFTNCISLRITTLHFSQKATQSSQLVCFSFIIHRRRKEREEQRHTLNRIFLMSQGCPSLQTKPTPPTRTQRKQSPAKSKKQQTQSGISLSFSIRTQSHTDKKHCFFSFSRKRRTMGVFPQVEQNSKMPIINFQKAEINQARLKSLRRPDGGRVSRSATRNRSFGSRGSRRRRWARNRRLQAFSGREIALSVTHASLVLGCHVAVASACRRVAHVVDHAETGYHGSVQRTRRSVTVGAERKLGVVSAREGVGGGIRAAGGAGEGTPAVSVCMTILLVMFKIDARIVPWIAITRITRLHADERGFGGVIGGMHEE